MRLNNGILGLAAALVFAAPVLAGNADSRFNIKTSEAGVRYVTGGIGEQQAARMDRRFGKYSFKLVNVRDGEAGAYVSDIDVRIKNKDGDTVIDASTDGPWLFADLEPGHYTLTANFQDEHHKQGFDISKNGHERLVMRWKTAGNVSMQAPSGDTSLKETVHVNGGTQSAD